MNESLDRICRAAERILECNFAPVPRIEWERRQRPRGEPTKLDSPLTRFSNVPKTVQVETYAMSAQPFARTEGFNIVRVDRKDAPQIYNTDEYVGIDLLESPEWERILAASGLEATPELERLVRDHVFLRGPQRRPDHHAEDVPGDIREAKPKSE